jgi:hypothetical protein
MVQAGGAAGSKLIRRSRSVKLLALVRQLVVPSGYEFRSHSNSRDGKEQGGRELAISTVPK